MKSSFVSSFKFIKLKKNVEFGSSLKYNKDLMNLSFKLYLLKIETLSFLHKKKKK